MYSSHFSRGIEQSGSSRNARWDIGTSAGSHSLSPFSPTPG